MHLSARRRNAILIGVTFIVVALGYWYFAPILGYHVEWAGVTMLFALGWALGIMSYVLTSGSGD
jgi:uncharacterized membrane protein YdfJ with MMPL/SSD domain